MQQFHKKTHWFGKQQKIQLNWISKNESINIYIQKQLYSTLLTYITYVTWTLRIQCTDARNFLHLSWFFSQQQVVVVVTCIFCPLHHGVEITAVFLVREVCADVDYNKIFVTAFQVFRNLCFFRRHPYFVEAY